LLATTGIDVGGSSGAVVAAAFRYHDTVYFPSWREQQGLPLVDLAVDVEVLTISGAPRAAEMGT
jgi:cysteine synthase